MRQQTAFTLIKLLVVVAIIAVIASLLMTVIAQAQSLARSTASLSSLRPVSLVALSAGTGVYGTPLPVPATGASVDESQVKVTLHISPEGDDANIGTAEAPLRSFKKAMQAALVLKGKGTGVKVLLHDGIYRETIGGDESEYGGMKPEADSDAPLVIEAATTGKAILSGSEVRTGWTQEGDIWSSDWPHKLGAGEYFQGPERPPVTFERHLVFVDKEMLEQKLSKEELRPGTFFIDEAETNKIYVFPSEPTDLNAATVEAAVRQKLLFLTGIRNVVVRGLVLEHDNQPAGRMSNKRGGWGAPLFFSQVKNILIEDCLIQYNSSSGLKLRKADDVTVRNVKIDWSGYDGFGASNCRNILVEDIEITRSSFRGHWADHIEGWGACAFKFMHTRQTTFRRAYIHDNWCTGMWWDTDNADILAEDCISVNNFVRAIFIELNQGPTLVKNSVFAFTRLANKANVGYQGGLQIATSAGVTIENCIVFGNEGRQVNFWNQIGRIKKPQSFELNFETQEPMRHGFQISFRNNFIGSTVAEQALYKSYFRIDDTEQKPRTMVDFVEFANMSGNAYWHPNPDSAFTLGGEGTSHSLAQWQEAIGADKDAAWVDPFADDLSAVLPQGISTKKVTDLLGSENRQR